MLEKQLEKSRKIHKLTNLIHKWKENCNFFHQNPVPLLFSSKFLFSNQLKNRQSCTLKENMEKQ